MTRSVHSVIRDLNQFGTEGHERLEVRGEDLRTASRGNWLERVFELIYKPKCTRIKAVSQFALKYFQEHEDQITDTTTLKQLLPTLRKGNCGRGLEELISRIEERLKEKATIIDSEITTDHEETDFRGDVSLSVSESSEIELSESIRELPEGAFGPAEWEKYFKFAVDDAPPVPEEFLESWEQPCPFFKEENKNVSETQALFLVPKGLSINKMGELAKNPAQGHKVENGYDFLWDKIKDQYGDEEVQESYWVLMTKNVIPDSRRKTRDAQLAMASSAEGYEAPSLLEAIICNYVEHVRSGERLFSKNPWTFTCCREAPIDLDKLVVGGFACAGLNVHDAYFYYCDSSDYVGVAGVLRK